MCTGFFKFGDVESGATMTLNVTLLLFRWRPCPFTVNGVTKSASPTISTISGLKSCTTAATRKLYLLTRMKSSKRRGPSWLSCDRMIYLSLQTANHHFSLPLSASILSDLSSTLYSSCSMCWFLRLFVVVSIRLLWVHLNFRKLIRGWVHWKEPFEGFLGIVSLRNIRLFLVLNRLE